MRCLVIRPGAELQLVELPSATTETLHDFVQGYVTIPVMYPGELAETSVALHCDEEGLLKGLQPTVFVPDVLEILVGPLVLLGVTTTGGYRGLTQREIEAVRLVRIDGTPVPRLEYVRPCPSSETSE